MSEAIDVLIVEDEEGIREPTVFELQTLGYRVDAAEDGREALDKLSKKSFDIIFTDIKMPLLDGFGLLSEAQKRYPDLPVVLTTAFERQYGSKALSAGAADVMFKPYEVSELDIRLRRAVEHVRTKKQKTELEDASRDVMMVLIEELETGHLPDLERDLGEIGPFAYDYSGSLDVADYAAFLHEHGASVFPEVLKGLNRTLHTLKGTAGMVQLTKLQGYAHRLEDLSIAVFEGRLVLDRALFEIIARAPAVVARFLTTIREEFSDKSVSIDKELQEIEQGQKDAQAALGDLRINLGELAAKKGATTKRARKELRVSIPLEVYNDLVEEAVQLIQNGLQLMRRNGVNSDNFSNRADDMLNKMIAAPKEALDLLRYKRTVDDLKRTFGKEISFRTIRNQARALPNVWERCNAALIHLVRNAVDHGIELPEVRVEKGKPREGIISFDLREDYRNVYITLEDDGAGIDAERVAKAAVAKGIVTQTELDGMTESQIQRLIFTQVSTKEEVSNVSGRGVGMGAAMQEIESGLGGRLLVESQKGAFTRVTIEIPKVNVLTECLLFGDNSKHRGPRYSYALPYDGSIQYLPYDESCIVKVFGRHATYHNQKLDIDPMPLVDTFAHLGHARETTETTTIIRVGRESGSYGLIVPEAMGHRRLNIERNSGDSDVVFGYASMGDKPIVVLELDALTPEKVASSNNHFRHAAVVGS